MKNSDERFLQALTLIKLKCDTSQKVKFKGICETFGITPGVKLAMTKLAIIKELQEPFVYQWISNKNPDFQMVKDIKSVFKRDKQKAIPKEQFENLTVDDKINHIEFMLNQIFERVNYLFENLADKKQVQKIDSSWFKENEATN